MVSPPQLTVKVRYFEEGLVIESVMSFSICFLLKASVSKYLALLKSLIFVLLTINSFEKRESLWKMYRQCSKVEFFLRGTCMKFLTNEF